MASDLKGGPFSIAKILPDRPEEASPPNRVSWDDDSPGQPQIDGVINANQDIETMTGSKVFLKLFVRVQKNWRKDTKATERFGY